MSGVQDTLAQLFSKSSITLPVFGKEVIIKKVTLRTMKPVTDLIAQVMVDVAVVKDESSLSMDSIQQPSFILKLISKYYDELLDAVVSLCSVTRDELLDMEPDESVLLIQAVIVLNRDFFMKKVLPSLRLLDESMASTVSPE